MAHKQYFGQPKKYFCYEEFTVCKQNSIFRIRHVQYLIKIADTFRHPMDFAGTKQGHFGNQNSIFGKLS